jgi:hypothetical protein
LASSFVAVVIIDNSPRETLGDSVFAWLYIQPELNQETPMAKFWTEDEYAITDAAYQDAVEKKKRGGRVVRSDIVDQCKRGLPKRDPSSIGPHLGNLTTARSEVGLAVLDEVAPFANRPEKLVIFLKQKYRLL